MEEQYQEVAGVDLDGNAETLLQVQYATPMGVVNFEEHFICPVANRVMPKAEGVLFRGRYYSPEAAEEKIQDAQLKRSKNVPRSGLKDKGASYG